jgi:TnpA family transposase
LVTEFITAHWDDLLHVAGSLLTRSVLASELLRVLQGGGRPTSSGWAVAEISRIAKTIFLLAYLDDESYHDASWLAGLVADAPGPSKG